MASENGDWKTGWTGQIYMDKQGYKKQRKQGFNSGMLGGIGFGALGGALGSIVEYYQSKERLNQEIESGKSGK
jgi:hypothetical protein